MDVLRGQAEAVEIVVSRCVSVCVEAGGEVAARHRNPHHGVADACIRDKEGWRLAKHRGIHDSSKASIIEKF